MKRIGHIDGLVDGYIVKKIVAWRDVNNRNVGPGFVRKHNKRVVVLGMKGNYVHIRKPFSKKTGWVHFMFIREIKYNLWRLKKNADSKQNSNSRKAN